MTENALQPTQPPEQDSLATLPENLGNLLLNTKQLMEIGKLANMYAKSTMVPANYQGNPANCFVALELAARMNVSPVLVMQQLYIVQGKPAWSGQACVALINGCGQFDALEYVYVGEPGTLSYGCYAQAMRRATGVMVKGTTITLQTAKDEGWLDKSGSKWKTMPEQMLKYRAASFFARVECPNVLMGFQLDDEVRDMRGNHPDESPRIVITLNDEEE